MSSAERMLRRETEKGPVTVSKIVTISILIAVTVFIGWSSMDWGGMYQSSAAKLYWVGVALWGLIAFSGIIALREGRKIGDLMDWVILLFLGYAFYSYSFTPVPYTARFEMLWILSYAAVFWAMRYGVQDRELVLWFLGLCICFAVITCLYALWHRNNPTHMIWGTPRIDYGARISGTFGCPNHFANFCVMGVGLCALLASYSRFPWPLRIFLVYLAGVLSYGILLSVSRGGYIAWMISVLVLGVFLFKGKEIRWWWKLGLIMVVVIGAVVAVQKSKFAMSRIQKTFVSKSNNQSITVGSINMADIRVKLSKDAIKIWNKSPVVGTGMASYDLEQLRIHESDLGSRAVYTHNDYLNLLSDYGIVGVIIVAVFFLLYFVTLWWRKKGHMSERETLFRRLGWVITLAMLTHCVVDFNLHIPACALLFFMVLGASVMKPSHDCSSGPFWRSFAPVLIVLGLGAILFIGKEAAKIQYGISTLDLKTEEFLAMTPEELERRGDALYRKDPLASQLFVKVGSAFRVRASKLNDELATLFDQNGRLLPGKQEPYREILLKREKMGKLALKYYDRAFQISPIDDRITIKMAITYDILERYMEAYLAYNKAIQHQPHNRYFQYVLGYHFMATGHLDQAIQAFQQASRVTVLKNRVGTKEALEVRNKSLNQLKRLKQIKKQREAKKRKNNK